MAKYLVFDRKQLNASGMVSLRRGDDIALLATIVDKYARYETTVDLTGLAGATAFWPAATGGSFPGTVDVISDKGGQIELALASGLSAALALEETSTMYIVTDIGGLETIETQTPILEIRDRGFIES